MIPEIRSGERNEWERLAAAAAAAFDDRDLAFNQIHDGSEGEVYSGDVVIIIIADVVRQQQQQSTTTRAAAAAVLVIRETGTHTPANTHEVCEWNKREKAEVVTRIFFSSTSSSPSF
jgi:hypothetical protein